MYMSTQNGCSLATFLIKTESRNTYANPEKTMAVMASDSSLPHFSSLRLSLTSRRHHAQSLLGPSFHDPRTHNALESHPERAAPLSRRNDERRHAVGSHSALALRLYLAACNPSSSCCFWVLDHLCSNLSQSFHFCWITETLFLNLCVFFCLFFLCLCFSNRNELQLLVPFCNLVVITTAIPLFLYLSIVSWQYQKYWTILVFVLCLLCVTPLVFSSYSFEHIELPAKLLDCSLRSNQSNINQVLTPLHFFSSWWQKECELFRHTLVLQWFPSTSSRQPQTTHVFSDSRIGLPCHALRICVAHAPHSI